MSYLIAITGKGGVGKTTVSALLVKYLIKNKKGPVLAIDADPNSCLDAALGVTVAGTVGKAREEVRDKTAAGGASVSKRELLELKISESLVESDGFDLIAMGRPEGAGCYCYANDVLKQVIKRLAGGYPYVVLDNEAGLENLSRRIVQSVDLLVLVSDASNAGLNTLSRLHDLAKEMNIKYGKLWLVVNKVRENSAQCTVHSAQLKDKDNNFQLSTFNFQLSDKTKEIKEKTHADRLIALPDDAEVAEFAENNRSLRELPDGNSVAKIINELVKEI